jgi:hypothetical protein
MLDLFILKLHVRLIHFNFIEVFSSHAFGLFFITHLQDSKVIEV